MKKFLLIITLLLIAGCTNQPPEIEVGGRTSNFWNTVGDYLRTTKSEGYDILVNGTDKYVNFNTTSGTSGYGFRDNSGTIQWKNSAGAWANISSGGAASVAGLDTEVQFNDGGVFGADAAFIFQKTTDLLTVTNLTVSTTMTGTLTGNADTATALAANGANCSAGNYPLGVDASGAAESCTAVPVVKTYYAGTNLGLTGTTFNVDNPVVADLTGNSTTATALAANGANCSAGSYPLGVDASGAVESCTADANTTYTADEEYISLDGTEFQLDLMSLAEEFLSTGEPFARCIGIENLAAADDNISMGAFGKDVYIISVWCQYSGTGTTPAQVSLEDGAGNAMTHSTPTCTALGTPPTAQSVTAANALTPTEALVFDVDNAVSPETDYYTICVNYENNLD